MTIAGDETFGPVMPLVRFKSDVQAIEMANNTEFGLAAYLFSRDAARIWRTAEAVESTAGEAVVVRRFIKLVGRGEQPEPTGFEGTFIGAISGKTYFRLPLERRSEY